MKVYEIKLDKVRKLKLPNSSIKKLEELLGGGVFEIVNIDPAQSQQSMGMAVMSKFTSIDILSKVVYCGLLWNSELTLEEVIDIIPMNRSIEIATDCMNMVFEAYGLSDGAETTEKK